MNHAEKHCCHGFTIIELMITLAILSLIMAIAIPAYNGYIQESMKGTARANVEPLRLALEDYALENGTYAPFNGKIWNPSGAKTLWDDMGWRPEGDNNAYIYTVDATQTTWGVLVEPVDGSNNWARCEKRVGCCYSDTPGASKVACPGGS